MLITCQLCGAVTASDLLAHEDLQCSGCGQVLRSARANKCPECEFLRKEIESLTRWIHNHQDTGLHWVEEVRRLKQELAEARGASKKAHKRKPKLISLEL